MRPIVALEPVDVENGGLTFREVVTVTRIEGGVADNVVPGPRRGHAELPLRAGAIAGRGGGTAARARRRRRDPEPLARGTGAGLNQLLERLRSAGGFALAPKQAWTPVAQFAERGLDAVNLGPGATRYAHRVDEQVEIAELARTFEALTAFALGTV